MGSVAAQILIDAGRVTSLAIVATAAAVGPTTATVVQCVAVIRCAGLASAGAASGLTPVTTIESARAAATPKACSAIVVTALGPPPASVSEASSSYGDTTKSG